MEVDMYACRVCLCMAPPYCGVFDYLQDEDSFVCDMIAALCSVYVRKGDSLPRNVCSPCFANLKVAYCFWKLCRDTEVKLKYMTNAEERAENNARAAAVHASLDQPCHAAHDPTEEHRELEIKQEPIEDENVEEETFIVPIKEEVLSDDPEDKQSSKQESQLPTPLSLSVVQQFRSVLTLSPKPIEKVKNFKCKKCEYTGNTKGAMDEHMLKHNNEQVLRMKTLLRKNSDIYICDKCYNIYSNKSYLIKHIKLQHKNLSEQKNLYKCNTCNFSCAQRLYFDAHMKASTGCQYKCDVCHRTLESIPALVEHMKMHEEDPKYACTKCTFRCSWKSFMIEHMQEHIIDMVHIWEEHNYAMFMFKPYLMKKAKENVGDTNYMCNTCGFTSKTKPNLLKHLCMHKSSTSFNCDKCAFVTNERSVMLKHFESHDDNERFACDKCDFITEHMCSLAMHAKIHEDRIRYDCDQCSYWTFRKAALVNHKYSRHTATTAKFACDNCQFASTTKTQLVLHMTKHTNSVRFKCEECSRAFTQRSVLIAHKQTHRKRLRRERASVLCHLCPSTFVLKADLREHLRTHPGAFKHSCPECSYQCNYRSNLRSHMMVHETDRKYSCDTCGYTSKRKCNLVTHMMKHNTGKVYACTKCSFTSKWESSLLHHIVVHTSHKKYTCLKCNFSTNWCQTYKKHQTTHDREEKASALK